MKIDTKLCIYADSGVSRGFEFELFLQFLTLWLETGFSALTMIVRCLTTDLFKRRCEAFRHKGCHMFCKTLASGFRTVECT